MNSPQRTSRWWLCWIIGYIVLVGAVLATMFSMRQSAVSQLSSPKSISDWQTWREDVREQQSQKGSVERRVPKSDEPPALVLMRDFFGVLTVGALLFSSMLYWVIAWFVTGVLTTIPARDPVAESK